MSKRRITNICTIILSCLVFFLCNKSFSFNSNNDIIFASILLIINGLFLINEIVLSKKEEKIFQLKFNYAIFVFMMIISALSFFMYYLFNTSHLPISDFYLLSAVIFPVFGIKSGDQFIIFESKSVTINIDLQKKLKKENISAVRTENNDLIFNYKNKDILFRMGRSRDLIIENIDKIRKNSLDY